MREKSNKKIRDKNSQPNITQGGETQVMKKFLTSILAFVLVFTMSVPAFAQGSNGYSDVPESIADEVNLLSTLGVLSGYPDGSFKPDNTITRAEVSAVALRLLGLEGAAEGAKGTTPFADFVDEWATGYINIATQQGLLKGYTDGTVRASNAVTQAEALAIMIRVLGYEPAVSTQGWPYNYLVKAQEMGLTKGVAISVNAPASRGVVAQFAENALTIPKLIQVGFGDQTKFVVSGNDGTDVVTLFDQNLGVQKYAFDTDTDDSRTAAVEGQFQVLNTNFTDDNLDSNEIEIDNLLATDGEGTYEVAESVDVNVADLLGHYVTFWEKDGTIVHLAVESTEVSGFTDGAVTNASTDITLEFNADSEDYDLNVNFVINDDVVDNVGAWNVADNKSARLVIYDGEVVAIHEYTWDNAIVVSAIDVDDEELELEGANLLGTGDDDFTVNTDDDVYANGKAISEDDIEIGDMVLYRVGANANFVKVVKPFLGGELDSYESDFSAISVDGKDFDTNGIGTTLFTTAGDADGSSAVTTADDIEDLLGEEVTVYFNSAGYVWYISGDVDSNTLANSEYLVVMDAKSSGFDDLVKFMNSEGDMVSYVFDADIEDEDGNAVAWADYADLDAAVPGDYRLVKVDVDEDGNVTLIQWQTDDVVAAPGSIADGDLNDDGKLITVGAATYRVTADTLFFDTQGEEVVTGLEVLDSDLSGGELIVVDYLLVKNSKIVVAVAHSNQVGDAISDYFASSTDSDDTYVVQSVKNVAGDDIKVTVVGTDGKSSTFLTEESLSVGDIVEVVIDGDRITDSNAGSGTTQAAVDVLDGDYDKAANTITSDVGTTYFLSDDVVILDTNDDYKVISDNDLEDENDGTTITVDLYDFDDDGLYDFVILQ